MLNYLPSHSVEAKMKGLNPVVRIQQTAKKTKNKKTFLNQIKKVFT